MQYPAPRRNEANPSLPMVSACKRLWGEYRKRTAMGLLNHISVILLRAGEPELRLDSCDAKQVGLVEVHPP